jgi:hypothetical protein
MLGLLASLAAPLDPAYSLSAPFERTGISEIGNWSLRGSSLSCQYVAQVQRCELCALRSLLFDKICSRLPPSWNPFRFTSSGWRGLCHSHNTPGALQMSLPNASPPLSHHGCLCSKHQIHRRPPSPLPSAVTEKPAFKSRPARRELEQLMDHTL